MMITLYYLKNYLCVTVCLRVYEIIDILSILHVNKAIGAHLICHKVLKATKFTIVKPIFLLFNRSLTETVFPIMWKQANVTPLFKKDNPSVFSNYRPVLFLSCIGKVVTGTYCI